ncbi:MAG: sulfotransferase family 2 domain-containing protein [Rhodobacteraceae bacterium]|nr:sulfotransferase family 2 domain-containing protein [Paracoccaceae bacterium]
MPAASVPAAASAPKGPLRLLRAALRAPAVARHLRARFPGAPLNWGATRRIAVFPGLGLAYNRVKKNANTTVVILLRELESGVIEDRDVAKDRARLLFDLAPAELARPLAFLVVVRNPYSRVLSAFLNKFGAERYRRRHGDFPRTREGFAAFVRWLEGGGLGRDAHWNLQTRLMLLPLARYDHVVRFEALREGLEAVLAAHGLALPAGRLDALYPSDRDKQTSADARLGAFYDPATAARVARLYGEDFAALGYPTAFPRALAG